MRKKGRIYQLAITLLRCFLQTAGIAMYGQDRPRAASKRAQRHQTDTLNTVVNRDSLAEMCIRDSLRIGCGHQAVGMYHLRVHY